jgi:hypothetical protein
MINKNLRQMTAKSSKTSFNEAMYILSSDRDLNTNTLINFRDWCKRNNVVQFATWGVYDSLFTSYCKLYGYAI